MYNLIMQSSISYNEWEANEGRPCDVSFLSGRIFEYTDDAIEQQFRPNQNEMPDFDALIELPCLFTYEGSDATGMIGHISRIAPRARGLEIVYSLPDDYPRIRLNSDEIFASLGIAIDRYENRRTHWAVKDVDLFELTTTMLQTSDRHLTVLTSRQMQRIWGAGHGQGRLVFLSHRASHRQEVSEVKAALESRGLRCFLAHEDVMPSLSWQSEILNALNTMDIFVGFVTEDFHRGGWTDQEIGYAHKRGVHRVFVKLGSVDPKGMVATEQALSTNWTNAADRILEHLNSAGAL
ncbi:MAG: toll/interleukin-1 receptor domain-containing protein [Chloroflexi bacterium]|nr:toll/interleukin-1 receptor domain-containing protein [Chloroflexota bacterium]